MREELIQFDTAKLAKEKGFNWDVDDMSHQEHSGLMAYFKYFAHPRGTKEKHSRGIKLSSIGSDHNITCAEVSSEFIAFAPTQSLLQRWLREEHDIHVELGLIDSPNDYWVRVDVSALALETIWSHNPETRLKTYELALEAGLKEALTLIN